MGQKKVEPSPFTIPLHCFELVVIHLCPAEGGNLVPPCFVRLVTGHDDSGHGNINALAFAKLILNLPVYATYPGISL